MPAHGFDKLRFASFPAENLSQVRDVFVEIIFFDDCVRPNFRQKFVFADQVIAMLDKSAKRLESLFRQRHTLAFARQNAFRNVQTKFVKLV